MGIFDGINLFAVYRGRIRFRDRICGGTPNDPKVVEGWLRTKMGITDELELAIVAKRTLIERGVHLSPELSRDEVITMADDVAAEQVNGFKRDENGLYIEARHVKAMLRECVNILYADTRLGQTRKGAKSYFVERVFVDPNRIHLGLTDPTGVDTFFGHVTGPKGPQSNMTRYEYVEGAEVEFTVKVTDDAIPYDFWPRILLQGQEIGLGAMRSQSHGRFEILEWTPLVKADHPQQAKVSKQGGN